MLYIRVALGTCLGLGTVLSAADAFAGAWTLDAGTGQVLATATASRANEAFDGSRQTVPIPRYNKFEFQTLFEYGVTNWFTAIVSPGVQHIDIAAPVSAARTGLGYSEFGGRVRLLTGDNWVLSGQSTLRVPGTFDKTNPAAIGYNDFEYDFRILLGYGFSIGAWPAFLDMQLGQRFRAGDPPSEVRADFTLGVRPLPQWLVLAQLLNVISEGSSPPLFPSYDYSKLQISVIYDLSRQWALQGGGFTTYHGRNALQENGLIVGAWYRF